MQTLTRRQQIQESRADFPLPRSPRRKRFSPAAFVGVIVTIVIVLGTGVFLLLQSRTGSRAANNDEVNPNCSLLVPANPLSAQGLATPYKLFATDDDQGPCHEVNPNQSAFVQAAVINPATGQIAIYNPLVIDRESKPAAAPVVPKLPANGIVAIWFGFNGDKLKLRGNDNSLNDGKCVNGLQGSVFGQFAYCNAPAFFNAANQAIRAGKLFPPPLGTARDGQACPSVRDFGVVDQDQSDNLTTTYLATKKGRLAQTNAANVASLPNTRIITNASDNRLLDIGIDGALGCRAWTAPDLADPGQMVPALPLNELQAAARQGAPVALIPAGDPMVLVNGQRNLNKLNAYRVGVNQLAVQDTQTASTKTYCTDLLNVGVKRIFLDAPFTRLSPSPDPAAANTLFTFLAQRFNVTWGAADGLNCQGILGKKSPIKLKLDDDVAVDATLGNNDDNYNHGNNHDNNNYHKDNHGQGNGDQGNQNKNNGKQGHGNQDHQQQNQQNNHNSQNNHNGHNQQNQGGQNQQNTNNQQVPTMPVQNN
jgi:hypothetical protein